MHPCRGSALIGLITLAAFAACDTSSARTGVEPVRDTLPSGAVSLRYPALPLPLDSVEYSLSIGVVDGDPNEIFGDLRGIEADAEDNIYVLDHQASEIRAFDQDGLYLRTLTRKGEGPGELSAANGMLLTDQGTLWVQDHGQWRMIELTLQGEELRRHPMHVLSYGYIWNGTVDDRGRFWKETSHSDRQQRFPPELGLIEGRSRRFMKWFDPATEEVDSVFLGEVPYRTFVSANSRGGYTYRGVPFAPRGSLVVDPEGGFWISSGEAYRIARLNESGDTTLVLEVEIPPEPVTPEDLQAFVAAYVERRPEERRTAEELATLAYATQPVIDQLTLDDEGRLWVRRRMEEGQAPAYDVFDRDGEYVRTVRLGFRPVVAPPPRIRNGKMYAVVRNELDVHTVVRAELPPLGVRN